MCHGTFGSTASSEAQIQKVMETTLPPQEQNAVASIAAEAETATSVAPQEKEEDLDFGTRVLTAVARRVVHNPQTTVAVLGVIHTIIAGITYFHIREDFEDLKPPASRSLDLMFQVLYAMTIDAVCVIFAASRSGVRAWHWKVNTALLIPSLCFFFVTTTPAMIMSAVGYFAIMKFVYNKIEKEADVYPVGLSKYIKGGDASLVDLRWSNFRRCTVVTLAEAVTTYFHYVCFMSPVIFFILHSAWVQMMGVRRSKMSSLYTVTFTSSMDTGMCVAMLDFPAEVGIVTDMCMIMVYWAMVHVFVTYFGCNKLKRCYELINNKNRYIAYAVWLIAGWSAGVYKHNFAAFTANLVASMFVGWTTVYGWENTQFKALAYGETAKKVEKTD